MKILMLSERPSGQTYSHCDFLENLIRRFDHAGMTLRIPHHTGVLPVFLEEGRFDLAIVDLDSPNKTLPLQTVARFKLLNPNLPLITIGGPDVAQGALSHTQLMRADIHLTVLPKDPHSIFDLVDCAMQLASGNDPIHVKAGLRKRRYTMGGKTTGEAVEPFLFAGPDL